MSVPRRARPAAALLTLGAVLVLGCTSGGGVDAPAGTQNDPVSARHEGWRCVTPGQYAEDKDVPGGLLVCGTDPGERAPHWHRP